MNLNFFSYLLHIYLLLPCVKSAAMYAVSANNMRNLQRAETSVTTKTTISDTFLKDMMVIGYFYHNACSSDSTPLITIRNTAEEYILMNLFTDSCTKVNVKGTVDSDNTSVLWNTATTTTQLNTWKLFGVGFKNSTTKLLLQNGFSYLVNN